MPIFTFARPIPIAEGMVLSDEPGFYLQGQYGIRLENLLLTQKAEMPEGSKPFLRFETLTLAPIDLACVEPALLTEAERLDLALDLQNLLEADLVSGTTLGRWQHRVLTPKNSPYRMLAEELVAWGGFSNQSNWDPALMRAREEAFTVVKSPAMTSLPINDDRAVLVLMPRP